MLLVLISILTLTNGSKTEETMKVLCVTNTAPDCFISLLLQTGIEFENITTLKSNGKIERGCKQDFILVFAYRDFIANLEALNGSRFQEKVVVLFCTTMEAIQLEGAFVVDSKLKTLRSNAVALTCESIKEFLDGPTPGEIHLAVEDLKVRIVNESKVDSLLNPLMTHLYALRGESRIHAQAVIFQWMFSAASVDLIKLVYGLQHLNDNKITVKFVQKLLKILDTKLGRRFREVSRKIGSLPPVKRVPVQFTKIAKSYKVDSYEINYIAHNHFQNSSSISGGRSLKSIYYAKGRIITNKV